MFWILFATALSVWIIRSERARLLRRGYSRFGNRMNWALLVFELVIAALFWHPLPLIYAAAAVVMLSMNYRQRAWERENEVAV